jgi:hypothetical protein
MYKASLIDKFTSRAADYQRRLRTVSQELRDLRALEHAQAFITDHGGKPNQDLSDAIDLLQDVIIANLGLRHSKD